MITQMRQFSLDAFRDIQSDGSAESQRLKIARFIRDNATEFSRQEISEILLIPINAVCGRVKELMKMGAIYESGYKISNKTGKKQAVLKYRRVIK